MNQRASDEVVITNLKDRVQEAEERARELEGELEEVEKKSGEALGKLRKEFEKEGFLEREKMREERERERGEWVSERQVRGCVWKLLEAVGTIYGRRGTRAMQR